MRPGVCRLINFPSMRGAWSNNSGGGQRRSSLLRMKIVPRRLHLIALGLVVSICTSCGTTVRSPQNSRSVAVAVNSIGGRPPSTEQVSWIHQAIQPELARAGFEFAGKMATADFIVTVSFTPNVDASGGRVVITSIEPSAHFRAAGGGGEAAEVKELRRRLREMQEWGERDSRNP